ncbi:MAG: EAL domain-containing protein [Alphaproteobacteria bacterium]|nr:EAL domain-containing protein [Alphaproteobacteria bacterium]
MIVRLRTKLALLYGGLFGLVMIAIAFGVYPIVSTSAFNAARGQLEATSNAFQRLEALQMSQLRDNTRISATDFGFRSAVALAKADPATVRTALANLRRRIGGDIAYLVLPDGEVVAETNAPSLPPGLPDSLTDGDVTQGGLVLGQIAYRAVAAPVMAPNLIGWLLVGTRFDDAQMKSLVSLSSIPIHAQLLERRDNELIHLSHSSEAGSDPQQARPAIVETRAIAGINGADLQLRLSYPLETALAPMRSLLGLLLGMGLLGLAVLGLAAWLLARSITRPIAALESATRSIEDGKYDRVQVASRDEIGRLANSFNLMAGAIEERTRTITYQAMHDRETGLPNRECFEEALQRAVTATGHIYVGVIGMDRFTHIRDAIGYERTGRLLAALGERLAAPDAVAPPARLSGELLVVAFAARSGAEAELRLAEMLDATEQPIKIGGQRIDVAAKAGFARLSEPGANGQSAVERASIALDQARRAHTRVSAFNAEAYGDPAGNLSLMGDMLNALASGDMFLAHQPKLNLRTGKFDGTEALIRWRHPQRGMIRPDLFVTMAEETGHIRPLTEWVLAQAIKDQETLAAAGLALRVSVNISGRLLGDPSFEQVIDRLAEGRTEALCFEITETAVMNDPQRAMKQLGKLAERGFPLSIDDYGSGLSSLSYLKMIPARELKIDRSLVAGLEADTRDAFLLRSTIDLGHGLGMKVVAEGIEDERTLAVLQGLGCDLAQGYLISRPVPLPDLIRFLKADADIVSRRVRASA